MRKRFRVLLLAAVVAAVVVPVGFALSLESQSRSTQSVRASQTVLATTAPAAVISPAAISNGTWPVAAILRPVASDATKLLFVGTILFALAAAVRKAM